MDKKHRDYDSISEFDIGVGELDPRQGEKFQQRIKSVGSMEWEAIKLKRISTIGRITSEIKVVSADSLIRRVLAFGLPYSRRAWDVCNGMYGTDEGYCPLNLEFRHIVGCNRMWFFPMAPMFNTENKFDILLGVSPFSMNIDSLPDASYFFRDENYRITLTDRQALEVDLTRFQRDLEVNHVLGYHNIATRIGILMVAFNRDGGPHHEFCPPSAGYTQFGSV